MQSEDREKLGRTFHFVFPRLRQGVGVRSSDDKRAHDRVHVVRRDDGFGVTVDHKTWCVLDCCTGYRELGEIAEAASARMGETVTFDEVVAILEEFRAHQFVHEPPSPVAPSQAGEPVLTFPPGARFVCLRCGDSCRRFRAGPLSDEYVKFLEAQESLSEHPALKGKTLFVHGKAGDRRAYYLARSAGACVFLHEDHCLIHDVLGFAAKPPSCRAFPFKLVDAPGGLICGISLECSQLHRSLNDGHLLEEEARELVLAMHDARALKPPLDRVALTPTLIVPYPVHVVFERRLLEQVERAEGLGALQLLEKIISVLVWLEQAVGSLVSSAEAIHGFSLLEMRSPEHFWEAFWECCAGVAARVSTLLKGSTTKDPVDLGGHLPQTFGARVHYRMYHALVSLSHFWEKTTPEEMGRLSLPPRVQTFLRQMFCLFMHNKEFAPFFTVAHAVVAFMFGCLVAREGALQLAKERGQSSQRTSDVNFFLSAWMHLLRSERVRDLVAPKNDVARFLEQI